ncbi:chromate transporter [Clostridium sp.]
MIYLQLFTSFFKIGLFSFGGGYAMITLISDEIVKHHWLLQSEFIRIIGIAEMTPGPIAVNSATFIGYKTAGMLGAASATLGVALPSLLIILFAASFFFKNSEHPLMKKIFYGIRPVIAGLILTAALTISKSTLVKKTTSGGISFNYWTLIIAVVIAGLALKTKIHPILLIIISGVLGASTLLFI